MVEADLDAHRHPTACRRQVAAELRRLQPWCLPDDNLLDSLALVACEVATVDSADWKNPLLTMRVACDSRAQRIVIGRSVEVAIVEVAARLEGGEKAWWERLNNLNSVGE